MVRKSLLVTGLVFAIYAVFIGRIRPHWSVSQHQWQDNQIKAEKYLYDPQSTHSVLVGSSLAARLDSLPDVYNLAFGGQSLFDGLALVTRQAHSPRTVYIEMNVVNRVEDVNFTQALTNPVLGRAKQSVLALRADKQPLAVLGEHLQMYLQGLRMRFASPAAAAAPAGSVNPLFDTMLKNQVHDYAQLPAPELMQSQFSKLRTAVAALEQRGVRVVFFEMPMDAHLCDAPKSVAIQAAFRRNFPASRFGYLPRPKCSDYQTTDGVHLNKESADRYTAVLSKQL